MLTQLQVYKSRIVTPPFPIVGGSVATDPIQIRNIEGLGPVQASVNSTKYGALDGEFYNGSTVGKRNIVITVGFNPTWASQSMESLRQVLYTYFMPKSKVRMRFESTHLPLVEIIGYVETCEPNLFSKDPEMQISIVCPSPYFVAVEASIVVGSTLALGYNEYTTVNYLGTVPAGFVVYVEKGIGPNHGGEVQIINSFIEDEVFKIFDVVINSNTYLDVSTVDGDKYAKRRSVASQAQFTAMGGVQSDSKWPQLQQGSNRFRVLAGYDPRIGNAWTLRYNARYGGL